MSAKRQWVSLFVLFMNGCSSDQPRLPSIAAVEPKSMPADSRFFLKLEFDGPLPIKLDYGGDSVGTVTLHNLNIADRDFDILSTEDNGRKLTVDIVPWLAAGTQDVRVRFEDGREVVLEKGFEVKPPLNLTGFELSPIGDQVLRRPFSATIRAQGQDAALFQGRVIIRSNQGDVDPKLSDAFSAGVVEQSFTGKNSTEGTAIINVEDYAGHTGSSNTFTLSPPP